MKRFTQIVIDSPPLLLVTDAVVLSAMVDGVILVVASGTTARGALTRAHRILENAGSRVLGMVLNKVDMRFDTYYGSYYGPYHQSYYDEISVSNPSHSPGGGRAKEGFTPQGMSIQSCLANESGFPPQGRRGRAPNHSLNRRFQDHSRNESTSQP